MIERKSLLQSKLMWSWIDLRVPKRTFHDVFEDEKHQEDQTARNVDGRSFISPNVRRDVSNVSKKGIWWGWRLLRRDGVLPWERIAQFPKKGCCLLWHKWMRILDGHRQNHSRRKTANALPRSFSVNVFRTLGLRTVLSPWIWTKKKFCAGNLYILWILQLQFECFVYELCFQGRSPNKIYE